MKQILCVSFLAILISGNSFAQSQNFSFPFANGASVGQQAVEKQIGKEVLKKGTQAWAGKKIMNYATENTGDALLLGTIAAPIVLGYMQHNSEIKSVDEYALAADMYPENFPQIYADFKKKYYNAQNPARFQELEREAGFADSQVIEEAQYETSPLWQASFQAVQQATNIIMQSEEWQNGYSNKRIAAAKAAGWLDDLENIGAAPNTNNPNIVDETSQEFKDIKALLMDLARAQSIEEKRAKFSCKEPLYRSLIYNNLKVPSNRDTKYNALVFNETYSGILVSQLFLANNVSSINEMLSYPQNKLGVNLFDMNSYGILKYSAHPNDKMEHDHIPSGAAIKVYLSKKTNITNDWKNIYSNLSTIEVSKEMHEKGRTYFKKNSSQQITNDSRSLLLASIKDATTHLSRMMEKNIINPNTYSQDDFKKFWNAYTFLLVRNNLLCLY